MVHSPSQRLPLGASRREDRQWLAGPAAAPRRGLPDWVVPGVERLSEFASTPRRVSATESQIPSPSTEGLVVVRAPLKGLAWRAEAEAILRRASCAPVKRQQ